MSKIMQIISLIVFGVILVAITMKDEIQDMIKQNEDCDVKQVSKQIIEHSYPYNNEFIINGVATCTSKSIAMDLYCNGKFNERGSTWIGGDGSFKYSFEIPLENCYSSDVRLIKIY